MQADTLDITRLLQLQKIDLELLRFGKKLEELPQRELILKLREKRDEVRSKEAQVQHMLKESDQRLSRIKDEDERLDARQKEVQEKINEVQGDYRAVSSLTKDLEGIAKRKKTLETELDESGQKNAQIKQAKEQIQQALDNLDKQEDEAIADFQAQGGALQNEIARLKALRTKVSEESSGSLVDMYEKKKQRYGGVGISKLEGGICSVCRNSFYAGRLFQLKSEAPLSECPSCKRMMVILDE